MRVSTSVAAKAKHNNLKKLAKGYRGTRKTTIKLARQAVLKAGVYAYTDRRNKKRIKRGEFIVTINAALSSLDTKYNVFIAGLKKTNIEIDRKVLASLARTEPKIFQEIVEKIK
jgi:large subunit ribosomal protein L20